MNSTSTQSADRLMANLVGMLPALEAAYKDIHAHPELSMHEHRTAGIAARHLQENGYDVASGVGKTGVVGLLRNGDVPWSCCAPTWTRSRYARRQASTTRAQQRLKTRTAV